MALNLTELSGYLTSLGPLPATSSCGSYPVCSIEMIGRGVQTGRLHRDHLLTMVHPVDECYNMLARICTCGSPCWDTRATSVEATVQLNNTILLNFTGAHSTTCALHKRVARGHAHRRIEQHDPARA